MLLSRWMGEAISLEISEDDWNDIWEGQSRTTNSRSWREFCWRNIIRYFVTPKLKFILRGSQEQDKCWRQCGKSMADHLHIFWGRPLIRSYWQETVKGTRNIFGIEVDRYIVTIYCSWAKSQDGPGWASLRIKYSWLRVWRPSHKSGCRQPPHQGQADRNYQGNAVCGEIYLFQKTTIWTVSKMLEKMDHILCGM